MMFFYEKEKSGGYPCIIVCDKKAYRQSKIKFGVTNYVLDEYRSLAEFNEDWEDYNPTEPLIKDEKIRKGIRAWAEANGIKDVVCYATEYGFKFAGNPISLEICFNQPLEIDTDGIYTIAELCGRKKNEPTR